MTEPKDLKIGDKFRLIGDACDPRERTDTQVYEVLDICKGEDHKHLAHLMVKNEKGELSETKIGAWVPLLKV